MRNILIPAILVFGGCVVGEAQLEGEPEISDETDAKADGLLAAPELYVLPDQRFSIDQVAAAMDAVRADGAGNVIVYVHGRGCGGGGEPAKSIADVMPVLEADYGARVVMFNWPGSASGCPLGFPAGNASAAGPAFARVLHDLQQYEVDHPDAGTKLTLITHSMGNIVLESAMANGGADLRPGLFDTVVLNSAATALRDHDLWLADVRFAPSVYVTLNDKDNVLAGAAVGRGARLGKRLGTAKLAANATYVDFTAAGVGHQYFISTGQRGQHMREFYDAVMNGTPYDFSTSTAIAQVDARDGTFVYRFDGR